jgi:murein L,D-transpeptidase YcbB/YkuD
VAGRGIIAVVALAASLADAPTVTAPGVEDAPADPGAAPEPGRTLLRGLVEQAFLPELRWASFAEHREAVQRFYAERADALAWFRDGRPTPQATAVVQALRRADEKGLDPRDYGGPAWAGWLDALRTGSAVDEWERIRFDVALTVSTMRLASDLAMGRLRARADAADVGLVEPVRWDADGQPDLVAIVRGLATADDVAGALAAAEPPFAGYRRTVQALLRYRELAVLDRDGPLPLPRRPLAAGARYAGAETLARRLRLLEDLTDGGAPHGDVFDDALAQATARFQRRHGLEPDGRLDARTVRELNVPLDTRVAQLALAVERWRWLPRRFVAPPVVVNIPEFRLHVADPAHRMAMRVVVGRAYRHRTPVFAAALTEVIFRPYWEVPRKIQREELVPKLEQGAARLAEEGYEILDERGRVLPLEAAAGADALERLRTGAWRLRQRPGPHNALGKVKLVFPNPYQVYLHDTPSQELFARSRRDFSHGCIRVEDAEALAAWVLRDEPGWTPERVRAAMDGHETLRVHLGRPTPVFVLYGTAVVADGGEVRFFGDLYGEDAALAAALAEEGLRRTGPRRDAPPG